MAHGHVHVPHELTEKREPAARADRPERGERILELFAVLLLSLTTLATAWSGYQAARWSGEQSQHYARASATRIKAQQQSTAAGQLRIDDLLYFNGWLDARRSGDTALAAVYRRRFRPGVRPAFRAWIAQRPFTNPDAVAGAAVHARVPPGADGALRASSTRRPTSSTSRARRPRPTTTATSSRRSSSRPCCSSRGSRCACCGGRCASACSAAATALLLAGVIYVGSLPIA